MMQQDGKKGKRKEVTQKEYFTGFTTQCTPKQKHIEVLSVVMVDLENAFTYFQEKSDQYGEVLDSDNEDDSQH